MDQKLVFFIAQLAEAAIDRDGELVESNLTQLIERLSHDGEEAAATRLRKVLDRRETKKASVARVSKSAASVAMPVDSETAFGIADRVEIPKGSVRIVLPSDQLSSITQFVQYVQASDRLRASGAAISPTMLLHGPPGTGKTLAARFVASELQLPLVTARTDGLISSYLGSTAKNVRRLFEYARSQPCVLFLDEFDAIAKMRDDSRELGELKRVVISLLQNIDTLDGRHVLIAATNHEHLLDQAIWRRFAYKLKLDMPGPEARRQMLSTFFGSFMSPQAIDAVAIVAEKLSGAQLRIVAEECIRAAVLGNTPTVLPLSAVEAVFREAGLPMLSKTDLIVHLREKNCPQAAIKELLNVSGPYITKVTKKAKHRES